MASTAAIGRYTRDKQQGYRGAERPCSEWAQIQQGLAPHLRGVDGKRRDQRQGHGGGKDPPQLPEAASATGHVRFVDRHQKRRPFEWRLRYTIATQGIA